MAIVVWPKAATAALLRLDQQLPPNPKNPKTDKTHKTQNNPSECPFAPKTVAVVVIVAANMICIWMISIYAFITGRSKTSANK